ncbi:MAG: tetratricopeptide repeat protein [Proteobacteria bacterium]|nr:tetratricopeptide repeat protein [Pseudomonadota bacterium]
MTRLCPAVQLTASFNGPGSILVAGCGTGLEAFQTWCQIESSSLLAVDLSRSSLAYAMRMAEEAGIGNGIRFRQADILELKQLDERFDFISSTGVLHHLDDPLEGWRVLTQLLKPDGVMCVGLYSENAGQTVLRARQMVRAMGLKATADDLRRFRGEVLGGVYPELSLLVNWRDFYSLSMFRDLVFHVNEHRFTPLRIQQCLDELGLEFLFMADVEPSARQRYAAMCPHDPWGTQLENWAAFEDQFPHTFVGMYRFFVRKRA